MLAEDFVYYDCGDSYHYQPDYQVYDEATGQELTQKFAAFSRAAETWLQGHTVAHASKPLRGTPLRQVWRPAAKPNRVGCWYRAPAATMWSAIGARLQDLICSRRRCRSDASAQTLVEWLHKAALRVHRHPHPEAHEHRIMEQLMKVERLFVPQLADLLGKVLSIVSQENSQVKKSVSTSFHLWMTDALRGGAGAAHRWTNARARPAEPDIQFVLNNVLHSDPIEAMQARQQYWNGFWRPSPFHPYWGRFAPVDERFDC